MLSAALLFLRFAWPFLLLGGAYLWADRGWCNHACESARADVVEVQLDLAEASNKLDALDRARIKQMERAAQESAFQDIRDKELDAKRKARFAKLSERAKESRGADLRFGLGADRLFRDIANAANAETAAAPAVSDGAGSVPATTEAETVYDEGEFKQWQIDIAAAFAKLTEQKLSCIARYNSLGQPQETQQ